MTPLPCWRLNFYGTEYVMWTAEAFHVIIEECEQYIGRIPTLWVGDLGATTWDEHWQLEGLARMSYGEL